MTFHPATADPGSDLDRLDALRDHLGLTAEDLDELVYDTVHATASTEVNNGAHPDRAFLAAFDECHDGADEQASRINNDGPRGQLAALLDAHGEPAVVAMLHDLAGAPDRHQNAHDPTAAGALSSQNTRAARRVGCIVFLGGSG